MEEIPVPKAGGNRRLYIRFNYVIMVYRETGGRSASKSAWQHVDERSDDYWNREVLGKEVKK